MFFLSPVKFAKFELDPFASEPTKFKSQITCIQHMIVQINWQSYKTIALYWGSIFKIYVIT